MRQHPSILITDDDRDFRETLGEILEPRGFRTLLAGNGEEALEIVEHEVVHVVLLDNNMPRLSGLETLHRVHQLRVLLPCILMSARLDEAIREQALRARAFTVLPKPVTRDQITRSVADALKQTYGWD
jgi:CheY-like chemotaxis protein